MTLVEEARATVPVPVSAQMVQMVHLLLQRWAESDLFGVSPQKQALLAVHVTMDPNGTPYLLDEDFFLFPVVIFCRIGAYAATLPRIHPDPSHPLNACLLDDHNLDDQYL